MDLRENCTTDVSVDVDKEELQLTLEVISIGIKDFWKDSSTLRDGAIFHNLAYISGKPDRIFMKILP